jgi:hypothetical protein
MWSNSAVINRFPPAVFPSNSGTASHLHVKTSHPTTTTIANFCWLVFAPSCHINIFYSESACCIEL